VRPNLTRADFGYVERSRSLTKATKPAKAKRDDEDEGDAGNGAPSEGTSSGRPVREKETVDFTKLDMATLKRYKRHYRLKTRQNVTKTELALAVAKHFAAQTVDEGDTIALFLYSARTGNVQYDRRDYLNGR